MTKQENPLETSEHSMPLEPLKFYSDKGADRAKWIAIFLIILLVVWMGSGIVFPSKKDGPVITAAEKIKLISVAVRDSVAKPVSLFFTAEGQALPDRQTVIRAETSGNIAELLVNKGDRVKRDQVLAKIDAPQKIAELKRAEEELKRTTLDYENAEKLLNQGVSTTKRVNDAKAAMIAAEAQLSAAKESLSNITITAPFDGRLDSLSVDQGEFLQAGSAIGEVVDNDPLTINIQVPQQSISLIKSGQEAKVKFFTGEEAVGKVSYVSSAANSETRTFLAEILVDNPDGKIPAGVSVTTSIPTLDAKGHFISPAILSLDSDGVLGVKTIDEANRVVFNKIEIIRAQTDGLWVTGLSDEAKIITVGQGFVNAGDEVMPITEEQLKADAALKVKADEELSKEKAE